MFSELNTLPGCASVNASPEQLPAPTHHSRPRRLARSYLVRLFHSRLSSGLRRRTLTPLFAFKQAQTILRKDLVCKKAPDTFYKGFYTGQVHVDLARAGWTGAPLVGTAFPLLRSGHARRGPGTGR